MLLAAITTVLWTATLAPAQPAEQAKTSAQSELAYTPLPRRRSLSCPSSTRPVTLMKRQLTSEPVLRTRELVKPFQERGFRFIQASDVNNVAMRKLKIDYADEEQRSNAALISIGRETDARLVAFVLPYGAATRSKYGCST